jgi:hypothetical protein
MILTRCDLEANETILSRDGDEIVVKTEDFKGEVRELVNLLTTGATRVKDNPDFTHESPDNETAWLKLKLHYAENT